VVRWHDAATGVTSHDLNGLSEELAQLLGCDASVAQHPCEGATLDLSVHRDDQGDGVARVPEPHMAASLAHGYPSELSQCRN
jgi:hypothetical protein